MRKDSFVAEFGGGWVGIDNDTPRVDRAELGPLSGIDTATSGTYYFDASLRNVASTL